MTQIFDENGHVIPVTVIEAGPCVVAQKKTIENDGYVSVQLAYGEVAEKKLSKPELGHLKKAGISARKHLKEFKLDNAAELEVGAEIKVDTFAAGDHVDVTGISKGHGYQASSRDGTHSDTPTTHGAPGPPSAGRRPPPGIFHQSGWTGAQLARHRSTSPGSPWASRASRWSAAV